MAAARQQRDDRSGGRSGGGSGSGGGSRSSRRRRADARRSVRPGFSHEKALIFGVIQVLTGIAALVLGVVSISTRAWGYYYASGFWSGTFFFVSGVFGLASARRKSNCTIVTFMVFSAMSAILALVTLTLSSIGVATENMLFQQHQQQQGQQVLGQGNALAVHSLIIVVSVIAAVCGTASSIVGCRAVCGVWYLPDNPYHSAADLQTPTSAEFSTGYRQNSNLQYLIDPDLRSQAQHLFASSSGASGAASGSPAGTSICPPASYEYPAPALPPPSGPQQIAILAPAADGSVYGMVQATSDQAGGISQVMYIMPNNGPCPQPGAVPDTAMPEPPSTPPPSYSQINLTQVGLDDSNSGPTHSHSSSTGFTGVQSPPELPGYTCVNMDGSSSGQPPPSGETTFPTQLPPLDRLIPLTGTRVVAQRTHRNSGQHRPASLTASRTSGTQTCSAVDPAATTGVTSGGTGQPSQSQRPHRAPITSQRHFTSSGNNSSNTDSHHRDMAGHRRATADCRGGNGGMCDSGGHGTCHRHSQSVGTQVGAQSGRSGSNMRTAPSRHHTSSSGASSRNNNSSSAPSGNGGNSSRGSRGGRDRHSKGPSETLLTGGSGSRDASSSDTHPEHSGGVILRGAGHPHRTSQGHWRLSGSFLPPPQPVLGTAMTSHPQELVVSSFPSEAASGDSATGAHRRWMPSSVLPPQYTSSEQHQSSNLSPLNSVL